MKKKDKFFISVLLVLLAMIIASVFAVKLEENEMQRIKDLYKDHNMTTAKVTR